MKNDVIPEEDKDVCYFGLVFMIHAAMNIITLVTIGVLFNMTREAITFVSFVILLRSYTGGYHSDNSITCYFISVASIILVLLGIKTRVWNLSTCVGMTTFSVGIIMRYAPVGHKNKPLEEIEKRVYKGILKKIVLGLVVVMALFLWQEKTSLLYAAVASFTVTAFMVILGRARYLMKG